MRGQCGVFLHGRGIGGVILQLLTRGIPADAGSTLLSWAARSRTGDYPCSRGAYVKKVHKRLCTVGGSLLARGHASGPGLLSVFSGVSLLSRGLRIPPMVEMKHVGSIPAHAGSTLVGPGRLLQLQVYPCSRGVYVGGRGDDQDMEGVSLLSRGYVWTTLPRGVRMGVSLLSRGLQRRGSPGPCVSGFIPALAGSTAVVVRLSIPIWEYPCSRGVYGLCDSLPRCAFGVSLLTRGLPGIGSRG